MTTLPCPVIVAHADEPTLDDLIEALEPETEIAAVCRSCAELERTHASHADGMIVTGVAFPDGNALDLLVRLGERKPLPAVVATDHASLSRVERASQDTVMAYLVLPITRESLFASMTLAHERHQQIVELEGEVRDLKRALEDRKIIERAKGVLMAREHISEAEAFARIRTQAQDGRRKMIEVARDVLGPKTSA